MSIFSKKNILLLVSLLISIIIFFKNAWVAEDGYIVFRSLEQLFEGNGPIWNPHERVQVFTSPLWYIIQIFFRAISKNNYLNVLVLSFILWIFTLITLKKIFSDNKLLLLASLLFVGSNGFFDYTSSGLENVLGYLLIALYLLNYLNLFKHIENLTKDEIFQKISNIYFIAGLAICVRHDFLTLLALPSLYVLICHFKSYALKKWIKLLTLSALPFVAWSLFSLIYYGFPFPNTAYAKLYTHISKPDLIKQGLYYLLVTLKRDTLTLIIIFVAILLVLKNFKKRELIFIVIGIGLNLTYIVFVGGDFMQGRFLSYSFLVSVVLILTQLSDIKPPVYAALTYLIVPAYLIFFNHTPFNSSINHQFLLKELEHGIADERGYYNIDLSLYKYLNQRKNHQLFPAFDYDWVRMANEFKKSDENVIVFGNIGIYGYVVGTKKKIIDFLALSDPLLARMPTVDDWRIGHFERVLPEGYLESVKNGTNEIKNPNYRIYYEKLKIVTQSESLFTVERIKTIINFNLGRYDYLVAKKKN
jgi:arabinofuranosyltransferase